MPEQPMDPALLFVVGAVLLCSLATCLCLIVKWSQGPLLKFVPRSPVPWNAAGGALAFLMVWLTFFEAIGSYSESGAKKRGDLDPSAIHLAAAMIPEVILVGGTLALIAIYFRANRRDLGLPRDGRELAGDVAIGVTTGLAALAPILLTQAILILLLRGPNTMSEHPLIRMLAKGEPDWTVMVLATIAAVVVAPVCEEIIFRLLLQGWLERWEAGRIDLPEPEVEQTVVVNGAPHADESVAAEFEPQASGSADPTASAISPALTAPWIDTPPRRGFAGLPFGLMPITVSSLLFALAHFGYGPEPIPLFLLALALGYVYFRTHRIVPSIIAHAIFNSFAMLQLWWPLLHSVRQVPG